MAIYRQQNKIIKLDRRLSQQGQPARCKLSPTTRSKLGLELLLRTLLLFLVVIGSAKERDDALRLLTTSVSGGLITHGSCTNGCASGDSTPLPNPVDTCSSVQGCPPLGQNDCYKSPSEWPWLLGGETIQGTTTVTVMDIYRDKIMAGGYTSDPKVCGFSQVYVTLVDQLTGQTIWNRSLNTAIVKILAIKFNLTPTIAPDAIIVVLFPQNMQLARVSQAGQITSSVKLSSWTNSKGVYTQLTSSAAIATDASFNLYMGTYENPTNRFIVYKFNPYLSSFTAFLTWDIYLPNGSCTCLRLSQDFENLYVAGQVNKRAYVGALDKDGISRWYFVRVSTSSTISEIVTQLTLFKDASELYWRLFASIEEQDTTATAKYTLIFMNMWLTSAKNPQSPIFLRSRTVSSQYQYLDMKNASKDLTIVFVQNLGDFSADMFLLNWSTKTMVQRDYNYGPSEIWYVSAAILFPSATVDQTVFFGGYTNSIWGARSCSATSNAFYQMTAPGLSITTGFGFINVISPNYSSCARPTVKQEIITLSTVSSYLGKTTSPPTWTKAGCTCTEQNGTYINPNSACSPYTTFKTTFCQQVKSLCSEVIIPPTISSDPIPNQTWSKTSNFKYTFNYWTYGGTICGQACLGSAIFYELKVEFGGNILTSHPFFLSSNNIYGNASFTGLPDSGIYKITLIGNLVDLSSCFAQTFQVSVQGSCVENIQQLITTTTAYQYELGEPAINIPFPTIVMNPDCGNGETFELFFQFSSSPYPIIDLTTSLNNWTFFTNNNALNGQTLQLKMVVTPLGSNTGPKEIYYTIFINPCKYATCVVIDAISQVNVDGNPINSVPQNFQVFASSIANCPMSFTLQNSDNSPFSQGLISSFSNTAGDFTVFVQDFMTWSGTQTNMKLTCVQSQALVQTPITNLFKIVVGVDDGGSQGETCQGPQWVFAAKTISYTINSGVFSQDLWNWLLQANTPNCPIQLSLSNTDPKISLNSSTGIFSINPQSNRSLDGQTLVLNLLAYSPKTLFTDTMTLTLNFRSDCRDLVVSQNPKFTQNSYSTTLYQNLEMYFNWPTFSILSCLNDFTTVLWNTNTNVVSTLFDFQNLPISPFFSKTPTTNVPWVTLSPQSFKVRMTNNLGLTLESNSVPVTVFDPCFSTSFIQQTINNMQFTVGESFATTQMIPIFDDQVSVTYSSQYGDGSQNDLCGPQTYQLKNLSSGEICPCTFVKIISSNQISLNTSSSSDVGNKNMALIIKLANYESISLQLPFTIQINSCQISSISVQQPQTTAINYLILSPLQNLNIGLPQITKIPTTCDQALSIVLIDKNTGLPLPFVTVLNGDIVISTEDPIFSGTYNIQLVVSAPGQEAQSVTVDYVLNCSPCSQDLITVTQTIADFIYYLQSGVKQLNATFQSKFPQFCPLQYTLKDSTGADFNNQIFTAGQGIWSMNTNNQALAGTTLNMVITAYSGIPGPLIAKNSVSFKVTIQLGTSNGQPCTFQLIAPIIMNPLQINYFEQFSYQFYGNLAIEPTCGPVSLKLMKQSTMVQIDPSQISLDLTDPSIPKIKASHLNSSSPIVATNPLKAVIQVMQGTGSILSNVFDIYFVNPCFSTIITPQTILPLSATPGQNIVSQSFQTFQDSVSTQYGSGSGLCGPQSYQIYEVINGVNVPVDYVYLTNGQKVINLDPNQNASYGDHTFVLIATLTDYGISRTETFTCKIETCQITAMQVGQQTQTAYTYNIQQVPAFLTINLPAVSFTPSTCLSNLSVQILFQSDSQPVPFATVLPDKSGFKISSNNYTYSGIYHVWAVLTPTAPNIVQPVKLPYTINITTCGLHDFSSIYTISDIQNTLGDMNIIQPDLSWWQQSYCTLHFSLKIDNSVNINTAIFTWDVNTGLLQIYTDNPNQNGKTLNVSIQVNDDASNNYTWNFKVTFIDPAASTSLNQPDFQAVLNHILFSQDVIITANNQVIPVQTKIVMTYTISSVPQQALSPFITAGTDTNSFPQYKIKATTHSLMTVNNSQFFLTFTTLLVNKLYPTFVYDTKTSNIQINLVDPCFQTVITSQEINFPASIVRGTATVQVPFNVFIDSVSIQNSDMYGNGSDSDICVPQTYKVFELDVLNNLIAQPYLTLQGASIQFQPIQTLGYGIHKFVLVVTYTKYGIVHNENFQTQITQCQLTSMVLVSPQTSSFTYNVQNPVVPLNILIPQVIVSPQDCDQTIDFSIIDKATGLPLGFVSIIGGQIIVSTNDPQMKGVYNLELQAVPSGQTTVQTQIWPFVLTLKPCKLDQASVVQTISNFTYLTNEGSKELVGTFSNLYPQECPLTFQFLRKNASSYDITIFQFTSSTGKLFINTQDKSLGGSSKTMQLIAIPNGSTQSATIEFTVTFVDHCTQVNLSAPSANSPLSMSFYENYAVGFTLSTSSDPTCGTITYKILDSLGNPVSSDLMWVDISDPQNPKLKALILPNNDTSKLNTIKIQAIQGNNQTTGTISSPIQVLFVDPCSSTVISPQTIMPLSAIQNTSIQTQTFQLFKDSVSLQYTNQYGNGSGSDLCGPQSYQIYEVINGVNVPVTYVYLTNGQKVINLDPTQNTSIGDHTFVLITTLDNYGITHAETFIVNLSACQITSITAGSTYTSVYDYYVTIPASLPVTAILPTPITLLPSTCPSDISLSIQFQSDGSPVPFATANPDKKGFIISTTSTLYSGTYNLWAVVVPTAPSTVQPLKIPFTVTIYTCTTDQVSSSSVALPTTYTIGSTESVSLPPLFIHQTASCQLVYSISEAANIFTFDSFNKLVSIFSNNLTLNGQNLTVNLIASSPSSGSQKIRVLSITLVDPCAPSVIQPWTPFTGTQPFSQNIFSSYNIPFTQAISSNTACGSLQYSLLPGNTSAQSIIGSFYLQFQSVKGLLTSRAFSTAVSNGIYNFKIKAELVGLQNVVYNTKEVAFSIQAVDPCQFSSFVTQSLVYPSQVAQGSQIVQISFNPFSDSVSSQFSSQYGNGSNYDICAPQVYNLYEVISSANTVVSYLTFSQSNMMVIEFNPNSSVTIGLHQFKLKVSLAQYPTISTSVSFQINVIQCQIQSFQLGTFQNNQILYEITQPTLNVINIPLPTVTITPSSCNQALIWQIADQQTGNGYGFISIVNGQIKISSNNAADKGTYQLFLKVMPDGASPSGPQQIPFLLIISPCKLDIITLQTAILSFTYTINSGYVTKSAVFSNLYPVICPMTFTFADPSGLIGWNGSQEINVLKTDRTLHGQVANIQLTASSQYATKSTSFSVTFQNDCANVILTAPTLQSSVTVPYYSPITVTVVAGQTTNPTCGPSSYKVINAATGLEVPSNLIWIDMVDGSPVIKFNIKPTDSVPANIKVKFIQGPDETGLIKDVSSTSIAVNKVDLCLTTIINGQLITAMGATQNQALPSTQTFQIFKDSVSIQFGNGTGYDLCGPQTYQLLEVINNVRTQTFAYITTSGGLKINVDPLIQGASTGVHTFVLITTLTDYNIKREEFFSVSIDQCVISGLQVGTPNQILYNYMILPNPQQLVITLPAITMTPSNCPQGIFIGLTDSNGQTPSFASVSQNPVPKIIVSTSNTSLFGNQILNVLIQPSGSNTVQPQSLQYTIQIDRCYMNTVSVVNNYTYLFYNFGQGPMPLIVFASAMNECPVLFSIKVNGSSIYNTNVFNFDTQTGNLTINTANTALFPKIYSIDLMAQIQSGTVTESFAITFQDVCDAVTLTDGTPWTSTQPVFQLYVSFNYQMKPATFTGPVQCGPPLYKILDPSTLVEVLASTIQVINQSSGFPKFQGVYTTRDMTKWDAQSQRYIYPYILKVYLGATTQYSFLNVPINIYVSEPCLTTVVNSQQIAAQPLEIILSGNNLNIAFQPFTDTVSFMYGAGNGYDICSPQTFLIKTLQGGNWVKPTWADVTPYSIAINNALISPGGVQTYFMRLQVSPLFVTQPHYEYFTLNVVLCKINSLSVANPIPSVYTYDIKSPATAFNILLPFISVTPNTCTNGYLGNGLDYKLVVHGSNVQPPFLTKVTDKFIINTSDPTQRGTWQVDLIIYPNALDSSVLPITKKYTLILSACQLANPTFSSTTTSIQYTIGGGSMTFDPIFSSLYPVDCVQILALTQISYSQGTYDGLIVSQFNTATGIVTFNSTKQSLKGTSVGFVIRATQNSNANFIEFQLNVNFPDQCQGVVLTKPVWQDTNDSYYLWAQGKLFFNRASASIQNCGSGLWSYKLIDSNTLVEIDSNVYTVFQNAAVPYVIATPPSRNPWLINQPWNFALKATYNIYGSVTSDPVKVPILDPCFTTIIIPQTVLQITTQANNGQIKTRQFDPFFDTISQLHSGQFGNGSLYDLCGYNQNYSVFALNGNGAKQTTNLVSLSPGIRQLNVRQTTLADAGQHNMVLTVNLPDFGVTWDQPFLVLISDCQVTSMNIQQPSSNVINYPIMQPGVQKFIPYPSVTISPTTCQQGFLYTLVESGKTTKPNFVTLGATGFTILTSDLTLPNIQAVYNLELKIAPDGPNTTGTQSLVYVLTLQRCHYDQLSIINLITDFNYFIGTGPVVKNGSFSHLYAECDYTLSLSEQVNTNFSLSMFSINQAQGQFTVQTNDILLSNKSINLKFTAQSTSSTNAANHFFEVKFKDPCYNTIIDTPKFMQPSIDIELWSPQSVYFSMPKSQLNCGPFTLTVIDTAGNAMPTDQFVLDLSQPNYPKVGVTLKNTTWLQNNPFQIALKAQLGPYMTINSPPLFINVVNPCLSAVFQLQNIINMSTIINDVAPVTQNYQVFQDSVSIAHSQQYGNGLGFDMCGSQVVQLLQKNPNDNNYSPASIAQIDTANRKISAGVFMNNNNQGLYDLRLRVNLTNFPSVFLNQDFRLNIGSCTVTQMFVIIPSVTSFTYNINSGSQTNLIIPYPIATFQPTQCNAQGVYTVKVNGSTVNPSFITLQPTGIRISTNNPSLSGTYTIEVTVAPSGSNSVTPVVVNYNLTISACKIDQISLVTDVADQDYVLGSGVLILKPKFQSLYNCPLSYSMINDLFSNPVTASIDNTTGFVSISATNLTLDGQVFNFDVKALSPGSGNDYVISFVITTIDICRQVNIVPPAFSVTQANQLLWTEEKYYFQKAQVQTQNCGIIQYRLLQAASLIQVQSTALYVDLSQVVPFVGFFPITRQPWIATQIIEVVIEAKLGSYLTVYSNHLKITIIDPCLTTTLNSQFISQMTASSTDTGTISKHLNFFTDSVSSSYSVQFGDGSKHDLCGTQTYDLYKTLDNSKPSWLQLRLDTDSSPIIDLKPNLLPPNTSGYHQFTLKVQLTVYSEFRLEFFSVLISDCVITQFTIQADPNRDFTYDVGSTAIEVPYPIATFVPDYCLYQISYSVVLAGTNTVPLFIQLSLMNDHFSIYTTNTSRIGDYIVELRMKPTGPNTVGQLTVTYTIEITGCIINTISKTNQISDKTYLIGSMPLSINGLFESLYPSCQIKYSFSIATIGFYNPLSTTVNENSPVLTISYLNTDMVGTILNISFVAKSVVSQNTATQNFKVTFLSGCENINLLAGPIVMATSYSFDLWQAVTISFNSAVRSSTNSACGSITYTLVRQDTQVQVFPSIFTILTPSFGLGGPKVTGIVTDRTKAALFPMTVQIKAQYGPDTLYSNPFILIIKDICVTTVLQTHLLNNMATSILRGTPEEQIVTPFLDSVSIQQAQYGNGSGFDLCGTQSYQVFEIVSGNNVAVTHTTLVSNKITVLTALSSDEGVHNMVLVITMNDYPTVKLSMPFTVTIVKCNILSLTNQSTVPDTNYKIGMPMIIITMPSYIQAPACNNPISYTMTSNGVALLPIMNFNSSVNPPTLQVFTTQTAFINSYVMQLVAKVIDPVTSTVKAQNIISFKLHLLAEDTYCLADVPSLVTGPTLSSYTYYFDQPKLTISGTFSHSLIYCEVLYELTQQAGGNQVYLTGQYDTNLFGFDGTSGSFTVFADSSQSQYDKQTFTMKVSMKGVVSLNVSSYNVQITVKNKCWDATITRASFSQTSVALDFRATNEITFTPAASSNPSCQSYLTYDFEVTNLQPPGTIFTYVFSSPNKVVLQTQSPVKFDIKVKTGGQFVSGVNLISNPLSVDLQDRCSFTTLDGPETLGQIVTSEFSPSVLMNYQQPVAHLATVLGIPDVCGPVSQVLVYTLDKTIVYNWISLDINALNVTVKNTQTGDKGSYNFSLISTLVWYPNVQKNQSLNVLIQDCVMTSFDISNTFSDIDYNLGQTVIQQTLQPFEVQPQCGYNISYKANLVSSANVLIQLPASMQFLDESVFTVYTIDPSQLGDYLVQITGTVTQGNQAGTKANFRFKVNILPQDILAFQNNPPRFVSELPAIISTVAKTGEFDLSLKLPLATDPENDNISLNIIFGELSGYIVYNSNTRKFELATVFTAEDVPLGFHLVLIELKDDNPKGSLSNFYKLGIDIKPPTISPDDNGGSLTYNATAPIIADISNTGLVTLLFNDTEQFNLMLNLYNEQQQSQRRVLKDSGALMYNKDVSPFQVSLKPGPEAKTQKLGYKWKIANSNTKTGQMEIQMEFAQPEYVSSEIDYDKFNFAVVDPQFYQDPKGNLETAKKSVIGDIIRQIDGKSDAGVRIQQATLIISIIVICLAIVIFISFLALADGDDPYLWNFFDTLQLLTHIQLMNVKLPGNAALFMNIISPIFRFDFIPDTWVNKAFRLRFNPSPLPVFQQVGYTQTYMLTNTVTLWVIFGALLVMWGIFFAYEQCKKVASNGKVDKVQRKGVHGKVKNQLFVGMPIRLLLLLYLVFCVTSVHNLISLRSDFSSVVAIVSLVVLIGCLAYVSNKYFANLNAHIKHKREQFGWLARVINLQRGRSRALLFPIFFLARRFVLALVFVFLYQLYAAQVVIWLLLSLGMMFTISGIKPFKGKWLNIVNLINEFFVFFAGVLMLPLSNILEDLDQRDKFGIALIVLILLCIAFNIIILLLRSFYLFKDACWKHKEQITNLIQKHIQEVDPEANKADNRTYPTKTDLTQIDEREEDSLMFPKKQKAKVPKDFDYDADGQEVGIKIKKADRKKPISFVLTQPQDDRKVQTMRNADNKRLNRGVNMATSMDGIPELQFEFANYKNDNQSKKFTQSVVERQPPSKRGNNDDGMQRRNARMALPVEDGFACKVEIVPINNRRDHYYILTKEGVQIAEIMPPQTSSEERESPSTNEDKNNINLGRRNNNDKKDGPPNQTPFRLGHYSLGSNSIVLQDDKSSENKTNPVRSDNGSFLFQNGSILTPNQGRRSDSLDTTIREGTEENSHSSSKQSTPNHQFQNNQNQAEPNQFSSNDDSSVLHKSSFASSNQLTETMNESVVEPQYKPPSLASDQIEGYINFDNNTNLTKKFKVDDKTEHESDDMAFEESHYSDPSQKNTSKSPSREMKASAESRNDQQSEGDFDKYFDPKKPAQKRVIRNVQSVITDNTEIVNNKGPQEPIYIHTREIIEIHHEHDQDPDHKCPYCDHGPVEKPKIHNMEDDEIIGLHNEFSSEVTSSLSSSQTEQSQHSNEHLRLPGMQQDENNVFNYNEVRFSHGNEHYVENPDEEGKMAHELSQDGLPIIELKFDEQSSINNQPFGKSFVSSNMGGSVLGKDRAQQQKKDKGSKMSINQQTGMPIIAKPTRITIHGDVPKTIKLPTDEPKKNTTTIGNVWQRAILHDPKQIVEEEMSFDEDSQILTNSVDARHLAQISDDEEESKGRIRDSAASSNLIQAPSDSESIDKKRNIRVHGGSESSEAYSRINNMVQVKNSLDSDISILTVDVDKRTRKVMKEMDLKNENLPKEYLFKDQNYNSSHDFSNSQQPEMSWDEIQNLNDELNTPKNQGSSFK